MSNSLTGIVAGLTPA